MFTRQSLPCEVLKSIFLTEEIFRLDFSWPGTAPRAGQFFMIRPVHSSVFLSRPVSVACWKPAGTISFLVALRGKGTHELSQMKIGDKAELTGPLGNAWADFPIKAAKGGKVPALVGGGIGVAPLLALARELSENTTGQRLCRFDFYAGFKKGFDWESLLEETSAARRQVLAFEKGPGDAAPDSAGKRGSFAADSLSIHCGRIPDFIDPADHSAVYACGPEPMLGVLAARCGAASVPCYVSMERRMACGVGACLGCTVETAGGNRRCCADGPIFSAGEIFGKTYGEIRGETCG